MGDPESTFDGLTWPDYTVIVLYFVFVLIVGLFVSPYFISFGFDRHVSSLK